MTYRIDNSEETIRLRRSQNTLINVGAGIILFGIWSAIKLYSMTFLRRETSLKELKETAADDALEGISDRTLLITAFVIITLAVLFEIGIRLYVGLSAMAEGRGKRTGKLYIIVTYLFILYSMTSIVFYFIAGFNGQYSTENGETLPLASVIIEFTNMLMMIQMVISAHIVRSYKKRARREETGNAA